MGANISEATNDDWIDFWYYEDQMISDGLSAPLHPGALKYYKERGWM